MTEESIASEEFQGARVLPFFEEGEVAVALAANDYYVPYVSVVLQSITDNASSSRNYDIIVLHDDITDRNQEVLVAQLYKKPNFSLRFIDVGEYASRYENLYTRGHFAIQTYYRLFMPELLTGYHKILYLDSDLVVCSDIAELFDVQMDDCLIAAAKDADTAGLYNGFFPTKKRYMDEVLKIKNPYDYFQAGVALFNLDAFRNTYSLDDMLSFAMSEKWELLDQDVLNYLTQDKVKYVDMAWNSMTDWAGIRVAQIIPLAPENLQRDYLEARKNPKIIHYAGPDKPWFLPESDYASVFWNYARKSPLYEVILKRMAENATVPLRQRIEELERMSQPLHRKAIEKVFPADTQRRQAMSTLKQVFVKPQEGAPPSDETEKYQV